MTSEKKLSFRHAVPVAAALAPFLFVAGAHAEAVPAPAVPDAPLVTTFADLCVPARGDLEGTRAALEAAGWAEATGDEAPELFGVTAALDIEAINVRGENGTQEYTLYANADSPFFVLLIEVAREGATLVTCQLLDLDAEESVDAEALSEWLGADPNGVIEQPERVMAHIWDFSTTLPMTSITQLFIPDGSPENAITGFTGDSLSLSQFVGSQPE